MFFISSSVRLLESRLPPLPTPRSLSPLSSPNECEADVRQRAGVRSQYNDPNVKPNTLTSKFGDSPFLWGERLREPGTKGKILDTRWMLPVHLTKLRQVLDCASPSVFSHIQRVTGDVDPGPLTSGALSSFANQIKNGGGLSEVAVKNPSFIGRQAIWNDRSPEPYQIQ
jgi:hypothetical protein